MDTRYGTKAQDPGSATRMVQEDRRRWFQRFYDRHELACQFLIVWLLLSVIFLLEARY